MTNIFRLNFFWQIPKIFVLSLFYDRWSNKLSTVCFHSIQLACLFEGHWTKCGIVFVVNKIKNNRPKLIIKIIVSCSPILNNYILAWNSFKTTFHDTITVIFKKIKNNSMNAAWTQPISMFSKSHPRKFRTFEKVLPHEQGLSEGQIFTQNFISILVPAVETHQVPAQSP